MKSEIDNPFVNWGEVELWRMLHHELPQPNDLRPLDYVAALDAAAEQVMAGRVDTHNTGTMLYAAAEKIKNLQLQVIQTAMRSK